MATIYVKCFEPSGKPQGGWKPVGLEKMFDSDSSFTVNHPSEDVSPIIYQNKTFKFKEEEFNLGTKDVFQGKDLVYSITVKKDWTKE